MAGTKRESIKEWHDSHAKFIAELTGKCQTDLELKALELCKNNPLLSFNRALALAAKP